MKNLFNFFRNFQVKGKSETNLLIREYRNTGLVHRRRDLDSLGEYIKIEN